MRILNGVLGLILLGFAVVQYNDPDSAFWIAAYGLGAGWTLLAALFPRALALRPAVILLAFSIAIALVAVLHFWPDAPGWWRIQVWWETETAREGMGMMLVALSLLAPLATAMRIGRGRRSGRPAT